MACPTGIIIKFSIEMKKIAIAAVILVSGTILEISAQDVRTPVASNRQINQSARIAHGSATGTLTRRESKALRKEQRHINRVKRRAKADGVVTGEEKHRINRKQRRANKHIRRQKHDAQQRY